MRGHTHLSADCSPHTRRIAGGGADSRISELSANPVHAEGHVSFHMFARLFEFCAEVKFKYYFFAIIFTPA